MATIQLTAHQKAVRSSVALKALMAVSGLIMVGYLLAHMYGNLKAFAGQQAFDGYSHHLRVIGEPVLPHTGLLWIIRVVLLAAVISHAISAIALWRRAHTARGGASTMKTRYYSKGAKRGVQRSYSSFTLRWGGIVILLFVIYHILHLTLGAIHPGGGSDSPYQRLVNGFQVPWVVISYTVAMLAVGLHLRHGVASALTTLGANTSATSRKRLNQLAYVVSGAITIGFLLIPFGVVVGIIH
ncbi:MAG: succinate dehydrogenase cytochrome b subunit [Propionibacteriaceae bacterium]